MERNDNGGCLLAVVMASSTFHLPPQWNTN
jgi:hypothetical protein